MHTESTGGKNGTFLTVLAAAGTLLVMAWLVWLMRAYTQPPSLAEARAAERMKIKAEFDAANAPLLNGYDWADKDKGFVRVPVERAKELILQEWRDPAAGRSNLLQRAAKEFAPAVAAKNPYE
jgi:hypothetical protein